VHAGEKSWPSLVVNPTGITDPTGTAFAAKASVHLE